MAAQYALLLPPTGVAVDSRPQSAHTSVLVVLTLLLAWWRALSVLLLFEGTGPSNAHILVNKDALHIKH